MVDELEVWMHGIPVAAIIEDRGKPKLRYTDEALDRFELGTPLLSVSLPLRPEPYPQGVVRAFLDGLLPEGTTRRVIAWDQGVEESDTFALIGSLGRECAGAVVIQPTGTPAPRPAVTSTAAPLADDELRDLVANLASAPLGVSEEVKVSLAGIQEKLLLTRMPDGTWGRPVDGTPSTHIVKPEIAAYPDTVANEAFCMRVAKHLGLDVASVETSVVAGRPVIVVERYDRVVAADGAVERLHQEDFCQVFGMPPSRKYQDDGGPSLRRMAELIQTMLSPAALDVLLSALTLNVVLGNGDAHGKNFSILHDPSDGPRLAPLYDLLSTLHYGDVRLAMYVDDIRRTERVTGERIVNEAVSWGMTHVRASAIVDELIERLPEAVVAAERETDDLPPRIPDLVREQLARVRRV